MFNNILVPLHLSYAQNHKKLFEAAQKILSQNGKMSLLYVNENKVRGEICNSLDNEDIHNKEVYKILENISKKHNLPLDKINLIIKDGTTHIEILETAKNIKADAIVMMATKPGISNYFISTTPERVVRHANCSVFIIRLSN